MTTAKIVQNERTAEAQKVTNQPDGPGLRKFANCNRASRIIRKDSATFTCL